MKNDYIPVKVSQISMPTNKDVFKGVDYSRSYFLRPSKQCCPLYPLVHYISDTKDEYVFLSPRSSSPCAQICLNGSDIVYKRV